MFHVEPRGAGLSLKAAQSATTSCPAHIQENTEVGIGGTVSAWRPAGALALRSGENVRQIAEILQIRAVLTSRSTWNDGRCVRRECQMIASQSRRR